MSISQIGLNTADWSEVVNVTSKDRNYATGTAAGDLMLAFASYFASSGGGSASIDDGISVYSGTQIDFGGVGQEFSVIGSSAYAGTEGASFTTTFGASSYGTVGTASFRGSVQTPSIVSGSMMQGTLTEAAQTCTAPSVNATSGDVLICAYMFNDPISGVTGPPGMTQILAGSVTVPTISIWKQEGVSGETGTKVITWTNANRDAVGFSFLLREGSGATPPASLIPRNISPLRRLTHF